MQRHHPTESPHQRQRSLDNELNGSIHCGLVVTFRRLRECGLPAKPILLLHWLHWRFVRQCRSLCDHKESRNGHRRTHEEIEFVETGWAELNYRETEDRLGYTKPQQLRALRHLVKAGFVETRYLPNKHRSQFRITTEKSHDAFSNTLAEVHGWPDGGTES
jgi:hypothetical protein